MHMRKGVTRRFHGGDLQPYGSRVTKMARPGSNLDLMLTGDFQWHPAGNDMYATTAHLLILTGNLLGGCCPQW